MTTPRNTPGPRRVIPSGPIRIDGIYPISEAMKALGWGSRSLAEAKRKGLRVLCFGKRSYLAGSDVLEFLRQQPVIERHGGNGRPDLVCGRIAEGD